MVGIGITVADDAGSPADNTCGPLFSVDGQLNLGQGCIKKVCQNISSRHPPRLNYSATTCGQTSIQAQCHVPRTQRWLL